VARSSARIFPNPGVQFAFLCVASAGLANCGQETADAQDLMPPEITLEGEAPTSVPLGGNFEDPGASAIDNIDGPIEIETTGRVDTDEAGSYVVTYEATDSSGNTSTKDRVVIVFNSGGGSAVPEKPPEAETVPKSGKLGAGAPSVQKCRELFQNWLFNNLVEKTCDYNAFISDDLGILVKNQCDAVLTESVREPAAAEVVRAFKADFDAMGRDALCRQARPGYEMVVDTIMSARRK